jgi:hypothetical protein
LAPDRLGRFFRSHWETGLRGLARSSRTSSWRLIEDHTSASEAMEEAAKRWLERRKGNRKLLKYFSFIPCG